MRLSSREWVRSSTRCCASYVTSGAISQRPTSNVHHRAARTNRGPVSRLGHMADATAAGSMAKGTPHCRITFAKAVFSPVRTTSCVSATWALKSAW